MTPAYAHGLDHMLRCYQGKVRGILNGIDYEYYNPKEDKDIISNFTWRSYDKKAANKTALQEYCNLPVREDVPVFAIISRLASHKGLDLIKHIMEDFIAKNDVQLVILGKGEYDYECYFNYLASKYKDKVSALLVYDRALSKRIYAAADVFLMPSKSEPCGLSQMIASRYGAVPVTRETGGLYDSIKGYYIDEKGNICGNGFTFANYDAYELSDRMYAALELYRDRDAWKKFACKVMREDFSWERSAKTYLEMYSTLL
jgi:starch synthase